MYVVIKQFVATTVHCPKQNTLLLLIINYYYYCCVLLFIFLFSNYICFFSYQNISVLKVNRFLDYFPQFPEFVWEIEIDI